VTHENDQFYTPSQIERLLRYLPYMLDQRPRDVDDVPTRRSVRTASAWREDQMAKRADVEWALWHLPDHLYRAVYLCCVGDKSLRDVARLLKVSHVTVRRRKYAGLKLMAVSLGWQDDDQDCA